MNRVDENFLGDLVPTIKIPMPEVQQAEELEELLRRVMASDIPGFVIRSSAFADDAMEGDYRPHELVTEALAKDGHIFKKTFDEPSMSLRADVGIGELHADKRHASRSVDAITVHRPVSGAGDVLLARFGPAAKAKLAWFQSLTSKDLQDRQFEALSQCLTAGETDPTIILPAIYVAYLTVSETVVFAHLNRHGPVPHRFDTTIPPRKAHIVELEREGPTRLP